MIVSTALLCLALNVYHEARGEPIPGQYAVALVTRNRAARQPDKVCAETFKRRQFSWTSQVSKTRAGWVIPQGLIPREPHAWWLAQRVAEVTLAGQMHDFTQGSQFYHTHAVRPVWRLAMTRVKNIGNHRFYVAAYSLSGE